MLLTPAYSSGGHPIYYQLVDCPKCTKNFWRKDHKFFSITHRKRIKPILEENRLWQMQRYSCFYCGYDVHRLPGGVKPNADRFNFLSGEDTWD